MFVLTTTAAVGPARQEFATEAEALTAYDNLIVRAAWGAGRLTAIHGPAGRIL